MRADVVELWFVVRVPGDRRAIETTVVQQTELLGSSPPAGGIRLRRKEFEAACPPLHHTVHEVLPDG